MGAITPEPPDITMKENTDPCIWSGEHSCMEQIEYGHLNGTQKFVVVFTPANEKERIPKNNPKQIKESFMMKVNSIRNVQDLIHTNNGKILAITASKNTATELASIKAIVGKQVETTLQVESNSTRFLLNNIPINTTLEELKEEIEAENDLKVHSLRRFTRKINREQTPSELVLVSVFGRLLPESIKLWMISRKIKLFVDRPRQCQNCWEYSHPTKYCRNEKRCKRCGKSHPQIECKVEIECCLCHKNHVASSDECSLYKKEAELLEFKAINGLSYGEARRRFKEKSTVNSYAKITTQSVNKRNDVEIEKMIRDNNMELKSLLGELMRNQDERINKILETITSHISQLTKAVVELKHQTTDNTGQEIESPKRRKPRKADSSIETIIKNTQVTTDQIENHMITISNLACKPLDKLHSKPPPPVP